MHYPLFVYEQVTVVNVNGWFSKSEVSDLNVIIFLKQYHPNYRKINMFKFKLDICIFEKFPI